MANLEMFQNSRFLCNLLPPEVHFFINIVSLIMDPRTSLSGVASGVALGDTFPVPPCFEDRTNYKPEN